MDPTVQLVGLWIVWLLCWALKIAAWVFGCFLFGLWWTQAHFLYMPHAGDRKGELRHCKYNRLGCRNPGEQQLPYEEHYLTCKDGVIIHCWFIPQDNRKDVPTIIHLHGNAGNIGYRILNAKQLYHTTGANILLVEYRGYGNSDGEPSEVGLKIDAQTILDWLHTRQEVNCKQIFVFGSSLGGAVGTHLAFRNQDKIAGLIIENTFTNVDEMAMVLVCERFRILRCLGALRGFFFFFLSSHWPNINLIPKIRLPILFLSGLKDELIPPAHMRKLYGAATASTHRMLHEVAEGEHNDTFLQGGSLYYEVVSQFMSRCIALHDQVH